MVHWRDTVWFFWLAHRVSGHQLVWSLSQGLWIKTLLLRCFIVEVFLDRHKLGIFYYEEEQLRKMKQCKSWYDSTRNCKWNSSSLSWSKQATLESLNSCLWLFLPCCCIVSGIILKKNWFKNKAWNGVTRLIDDSQLAVSYVITFLYYIDMMILSCLREWWSWWTVVS